MNLHLDISELAQKLIDALPTGLTQLPQEAKKNFEAILQSAFQKLNLVTREEFDVQTAVLTRTRAKLEQLEAALQALQQNKPNNT